MGPKPPKNVLPPKREVERNIKESEASTSAAVPEIYQRKSARVPVKPKRLIEEIEGKKPCKDRKEQEKEKERDLLGFNKNLDYVFAEDGASS